MELIRRNNGFLPAFFRGFENDFYKMDNDLSNSFVDVAANVKKREKDYLIELAIPGMDKKDIHINVEEEKLVISGEQKETKDTKKEDYTLQEFTYGTFKRSFQLPENINVEKITADYSNGVLSITVPQPEEKKKLVRDIKIK